MAPAAISPDLLASFEHYDDAGAVRLAPGRVGLYTVDFFPPVLDDPRHVEEVLDEAADARRAPLRPPDRAAGALRVGGGVQRAGGDGELQLGRRERDQHETGAHSKISISRRS